MDIKTFWKNSIWYIILTLLSLILLSYTLIKSKSKKRDFGFFLTTFGVTFLAETVIYIFLKAYEYYPGIIHSSPKNDGVIGNIVSQFSISTVALFICVFRVSFSGVFISVVIFYFIEKLFLALGIYQVYWYRPWITSVILLIGLQIVKKWYAVTMDGKSSGFHYFNVLLGVLCLYLPTTNWIGILSGNVTFKEDILIDPFISHAIVAIPKYLFQINIIMLLYKYKAKWLWNVVAIAVITLSDVALYYTNIIFVKNGWLLIYTGISILTVYIYVYTMEHLLYPKPKYQKLETNYK